MEKQFIDGLQFKKPNEKAPAFVKGSISINLNKFMEYADKNQNNGWINIDLKESKTGNYYAELNTFKPQAKQEAKEEEIKTEDCPF